MNTSNMSVNNVGLTGLGRPPCCHRARFCSSLKLDFYGRGSRIRICDLLTPNQPRYLPALYPVNSTNVKQHYILLLYNNIFCKRVNRFFKKLVFNYHLQILQHH